MSNKSKKNRRTAKNSYLYKERPLSETKQQKFSFNNMQVEDELDTSFLDPKKRRKKSKEVLTVEKKVYPTGPLFLLSVLLLFFGSFLIYHFTTFDHHKVVVETKTKIVKEDILPENIVFLGDSITDYYEVEKYYPEHYVVNSGISGNTTEDILNDMQNRVYKYNPSTVFILIGTNDLKYEKSPEQICNNIKMIVSGIKENRKLAKVYIESVYPINHDIEGDKAGVRKTEDIMDLNERLKKLCDEEEVTYVDLFDSLKDDENHLEEDLTKDGLHLNDKGYEVVTEKLKSVLKNETKEEKQ